MCGYDIYIRVCVYLYIFIYMYIFVYILVHRLHTDLGFTDTVLQWFSSYLTDRTHYVSLSNHFSAFAPVHSGVPQGSVLGPMLLLLEKVQLQKSEDKRTESNDKRTDCFSPCILSLCLPLSTHTIIHHSFADDIQLQMSAPPDKISELLLLLLLPEKCSFKSLNAQH